MKKLNVLFSSNSMKKPKSSSVSDIPKAEAKLLNRAVSSFGIFKPVLCSSGSPTQPEDIPVFSILSEQWKWFLKIFIVSKILTFRVFFFVCLFLSTVLNRFSFLGNHSSMRISAVGGLLLLLHNTGHCSRQFVTGVDLVT